MPDPANPNKPLNISDGKSKFSSGLLLIIHVLYTIIFGITWYRLIGYNSENHWRGLGESLLFLILPIYLFLTINVLIFVVNLTSFIIHFLKKRIKLLTLSKHWILFTIIFIIINILSLVLMFFVSLSAYIIVFSILIPIATLLSYLSLKGLDFPIFRFSLFVGNILWLVLIIIYDSPDSEAIATFSYLLVTLSVLLPIEFENNSKLDYISQKNNLKEKVNLNILSVFIAVFILYI